MKLTGYSRQRVSCGPARASAFTFTVRAPNVDVQLVRLLHGDENPRGPGFQEREISSSIDGRHAAGPQEIFRGSFAELETPAQLIERDDFEIDLWIWPTRPGHRQPGHHLLARARMPGRALPCAGRDRSGRRAKRNAARSYAAASRWRVALGCVSDCSGRGGRFELSVTPRDYSPRYEAPDVCGRDCTPRVSCSGDI